MLSRDGSSGGWRETLVDLESSSVGDADQKALAAEVEEVFVVLDAVEAVAVGDLVLVEEDLVRTLERRRNDEAAALVIERGRMTGVATASSTLGSSGLLVVDRTTPTTEVGFDAGWCCAECAAGSSSCSGRDVPWMATGAGTSAGAAAAFRKSSEVAFFRGASADGSSARLTLAIVLELTECRE